MGHQNSELVYISHTHSTAMINIQNLFTPCLAGIIILTLTNCSVPISDRSPTPTASPDPTPPPETTISKPPTSPSPPPPKEPTVPMAKTIPITLYRMDSNCENLVPIRDVVPVDNSLESAVKQILDNYESADFSLGYRIIHHGHTITIDFRVPGNSPRFFTSLSSCEQLALFGSLRKTLTSNPVWQIQQVQFTNRGETISL